MGMTTTIGDLKWGFIPLPLYHKSTLIYTEFLNFINKDCFQSIFLWATLDRTLNLQCKFLLISGLRIFYYSYSSRMICKQGSIT